MPSLRHPPPILSLVVHCQQSIQQPSSSSCLLVFSLVGLLLCLVHVHPTKSQSMRLDSRRDRAGTCGIGEWSCGPQADGEEVQCIGLNRFCDGIENCEDGSDEPLGCTNCNKTFVGEANVKYPIRVTGPFQRYLPFVCQIAFVAAGKEYGDFVELTFLSFQIGSLEFTRNQTAVCQKGYLKISEIAHQGEQELQEPRDKPQYAAFQRKTLPNHFDLPFEVAGPEFGQFCGSLVERSVSYFSETNNVSVTTVVPSRASTPSTSFSLYLTYRFLSKKDQIASDNSRTLTYFGQPVPGTYCDKVFEDCSKDRIQCIIRSPNFPGFYPRNITCQYTILQKRAPEGQTTQIVLSQPNDYKISIPTGRTSTTTGANLLLSTDCIGGDSVGIYDGPSTRSPLLLEFCGSGALPEVISSGNEVLLQVNSSPYQQLRSSRVEIDVNIRPVKNTNELAYGANSMNGRCSQTILSSRHRWGVVRSPNHSMPKNSNCTFRFIGASNYEQVWIYFLSYFSLPDKRPPAPGEDHHSCSSKLELFNSAGLGNVSASSSSNSQELLASFCGESGPKICAHASDYPPKYLPPRPCDRNTESYVSVGPDFTIILRLLTPATDVLNTVPSAFAVRYEFIDTRQNGVPIDHSECDRRFDSRLYRSGSFANPRNVLLYGRGGRHNISCMYHFVGLPTERVRLTIRRMLLKTGNSTCKSYFDSTLQKHTCKWLLSNIPPNFKVSSPMFASINSAEYWDGYSSSMGCLCNISTDVHDPPIVFESIVSNVKFNFVVNNMNAFKDFEDYGFEAEFEFLNSTVCEKGLQRQTGSTGKGVLSFQVPVHSKNAQPNSVLHSVRCRWLIEASPYKYLYLKFKGLNATSADRCNSNNRILVYLDPRSKPVANACVVDEVRWTKEAEEFDIFSHTWYNESYSNRDIRDRLFVELIANSRETKSSFDIQWLEVTKPFVRTQSGQTLRNVDCLFECPEIGACIDPELWCDGTVHCPSGYDESLEHCRTFPTAYVSSSAVGVALLLVLIGWIIVRRRRAGRRLKKKDIRRLPQDDCLNMESPVG